MSEEGVNWDAIEDMARDIEAYPELYEALAVNEE